MRDFGLVERVEEGAVLVVEPGCVEGGHCRCGVRDRGEGRAGAGSVVSMRLRWYGATSLWIGDWDKVRR